MNQDELFAPPPAPAASAASAPRLPVAADTEAIGSVTNSLDALAAGLSPAQHAAVFSDATPLAVLAGAGSGKTRVLTRRVARRILDGSADPEATIVVTFTRKAAGELVGRLRALGVYDGVQCGTFHSLAYAMLRERWRLRGEAPRAVLPSTVRTVRAAMASCGATDDRATARAVAAEIEWAKARLMSPMAYAAQIGPERRPPLAPAQMAEVYGAYEAIKRRRGVIDFEDMLGMLVEALHTDPAFAAVARRRTRHVFVDEFQDVNPAQHELLGAWLGPQRPADLFVVGDDDQSIYTFSGAYSAFLTEFARCWPGGQILALEDNFRCPAPVLTLADAVLDVPGVWRAKRTRAHVPGAHVPELVAHPTGEAELAWCLDVVRRHRRPTAGSGGGWSACAVLTRTNAQAAAIETALRSAQIPTKVASGTTFAGSADTTEALDAVAAARRAPRMPFADFVAEALDEAEIAPATAERLIDLATEFAGVTDGTDTESFRAFVATATAGEVIGDDLDAVTVTTMHRAKGLEFDCVVLLGLEEGLLPISRATTPAALDEERRLLYVAMTRARRRLFLSWARTRPHSRSGEPLARRPSRFLEPLRPVLARLQAADAPTTAPKHWSHAARERLGPAAVPGASATLPGDDPRVQALRARLLAWRRDVADREGTAPDAVLGRPAIEAIARTEPHTTADLAAAPGIDRVRLARHGATLLAIVAATGGTDGPDAADGTDGPAPTPPGRPHTADGAG